MKNTTDKTSFMSRYSRWILGGLFVLLAVVASKIFPGPADQPPERALLQDELRVLPHPVEPPGTLALVTEPDDRMQGVFRLIKGATRSIDLVMYEFDDPDIVNALGDAVTRGVAVRVMLNKGYGGKTDAKQAATMKLLEDRNVSATYAPDFFSLTHQKTMVVDGRKAFIMTFNFTKKYYATSRDFGILDTDPVDVSAIESTFNADWTGRTIASPNGSGLIWSPGAETGMLLIIAGATKTLDVYNEEMADDAITRALIAAEQRGVRVRVAMSYATVYKPAFNELSQGKVGLRTYAGSSKKKYIHAKMIIADGNYGFVGSQNFSRNSLEKNRELGIFVSDPAIIASLEKTFVGDWDGARVYKLK